MTVTDECTRDDVKEAITHVSARAARTLRKTPIGKENPEWKSLHTEINDLLDDLEAMPA